MPKFHEIQTDFLFQCIIKFVNLYISKNCTILNLKRWTISRSNTGFFSIDTWICMIHESEWLWLDLQKLFPMIPSFLRRNRLNRCWPTCLRGMLEAKSFDEMRFWYHTKDHWIAHYEIILQNLVKSWNFGCKRPLNWHFLETGVDWLSKSTYDHYLVWKGLIWTESDFTGNQSVKFESTSISCICKKIEFFEKWVFEVIWR